MSLKEQHNIEAISKDESSIREYIHGASIP